MERDDAAAATDGVERRVDPSDGRSYTKEEFLSYYRDPRRWEAAKPPTGGDDRRKVTAVLFANPEWRASDGGEELLLDEPSQTWHALAPKADTLLLFRSDRVLRRVAKARRARFALVLSFLGFYE